MMFTDYLDLRTGVLDRVGNSDKLTPVFDQITKFAEVRLNRDLRTSDQITSSAFTISSGVGSLPAGLLKVIGIYDSSGRGITAGSEAQREAGQTVFSVVGSQIKGPDGTYTLTYYAALDSLTDDLEGTNWLLEKAPDVYLYSICEEAAKWLRDVESAVAYAQMRQTAMNEFLSANGSLRFSDALLKVRGVTP